MAPPRRTRRPPGTFYSAPEQWRAGGDPIGHRPPTSTRFAVCLYFALTGRPGSSGEPAALSGGPSPPPAAAAAIESPRRRSATCWRARWRSIRRRGRASRARAGGGVAGERSTCARGAATTPCSRPSSAGRPRPIAEAIGGVGGGSRGHGRSCSRSTSWGPSRRAVDRVCARMRGAAGGGRAGGRECAGGGGAGSARRRWEVWDVARGGVRLALARDDAPVSELGEELDRIAGSRNSRSSAAPPLGLGRQAPPLGAIRGARASPSEAGRGAAVACGRRGRWSRCGWWCGGARGWSGGPG